jgi:type II secretory pathway predicted ATPase ExeA
MPSKKTVVALAVALELTVNETNATLLRIDAQILNIDRVLCRHIDNLETAPRGIVSQDIWAMAREVQEEAFKQGLIPYIPADED